MRALTFPVTLPGCLELKTWTIRVGITEPKLSGWDWKGSWSSVKHCDFLYSGKLNMPGVKWHGMPTYILLNGPWSRVSSELCLGAVGTVLAGRCNNCQRLFWRLNSCLFILRNLPWHFQLLEKAQPVWNNVFLTFLPSVLFLPLSSVKCAFDCTTKILTIIPRLKTYLVETSYFSL